MTSYPYGAHITYMGISTWMENVEAEERKVGISRELSLFEPCLHFKIKETESNQYELLCLE